MASCTTNSLAPVAKVLQQLFPPDADVLLTLDAILVQVYQRGAYARRIDYTLPVSSPISQRPRNLRASEAGRQTRRLRHRQFTRGDGPESDSGSGDENGLTEQGEQDVARDAGSQQPV
jgi:hypothetical protein